MDWKFVIPSAALVYVAGHITAHGYLALIQSQLPHPVLIVPFTILILVAFVLIAGTFEAWEENKPNCGRGLLTLCGIVFGPILFTYIVTYVHDLGIQEWAAWLKFRMSGLLLLLTVVEVFWDYQRARKKEQQTADVAS